MAFTIGIEFTNTPGLPIHVVPKWPFGSRRRQIISKHLVSPNRFSYRDFIYQVLGVGDFISKPLFVLVVTVPYKIHHSFWCNFSKWNHLAQISIGLMIDAWCSCHRSRTPTRSHCVATSHHPQSYPARRGRFSSEMMFWGPPSSPCETEKIKPKNWQVDSCPLVMQGFSSFFRVVSSDYGKPRVLVYQDQWLQFERYDQSSLPIFWSIITPQFLDWQIFLVTKINQKPYWNINDCHPKHVK